MWKDVLYIRNIEYTKELGAPSLLSMNMKMYLKIYFHVKLSTVQNAQKTLMVKSFQLLITEKWKILNCPINFLLRKVQWIKSPTKVLRYYTHAYQNKSWAHLIKVVYMEFPLTLSLIESVKGEKPSTKVVWSKHVHPC